MQNNIFFEMLPLVIFFVTYYLTKNIFIATGICILASWLQILLYKLKYNKITTNNWISVIVITILGGLTIAFHNKTFVMLKPTVLFCILGGSLIISQISGKNLLYLTLHKEIPLSTKAWQILGYVWGLYFIFLGLLNLVIAYYTNEYTWVKIKVFGYPILMLVFMLLSVGIAILIDKRSKHG